MNDTGLYQFLWIILVCTNFAVQILYFFNVESRVLYLAKKVTTPLMLFGGFAVTLVRIGGFTLVPGAILLAMGLGEIGIEGSRVVESGNKTAIDEPGIFSRWSVTAAGILFLLVNLFIGVTLLRQAESPGIQLFGIAAGFAAVFVMVLLVLRISRPAAEIRSQLIIYSAGLAVLAAGAASFLIGGSGYPGRAALILTISDSLVMIRMGAGWSRESRTGRALLLTFLITILLLYYLFIGLLTGMGTGFR